MTDGFVLLWRKLIEKGYYKKSYYVHLWIHLLFKANHTETKFMWNGKEQILKRGQLLTGRKNLSQETGIRPGTVENILKMLESEHQIEQQKTNLFRIITITNYDKLQKVDSYFDNKMTTNEQQNDNKMTHTNNVNKEKELKEEKKKEKKKEINKEKYFSLNPLDENYEKYRTTAKEILTHLNQTGNKNLQPMEQNLSDIINRLQEGFIKEQFIQIIETKIHDSTLPANLFRPQTLFKSADVMHKYLDEKLDGYKNETQKKTGYTIDYPKEKSKFKPNKTCKKCSAEYNAGDFVKICDVCGGELIDIKSSELLVAFTDNCEQLKSIDFNCVSNPIQSNPKEIQSESETNPKLKSDLFDPIGDNFKYREQAKEILEYLNKTGNKKLQSLPHHLRFIEERLREGFITEQFKQIIDTKIHDPNLAVNYFRPSTLFKSKEKMGDYLDETIEGYKKKTKDSGGMLQNYKKSGKKYDDEPDLVDDEI